MAADAVNSLYKASVVSRLPTVVNVPGKNFDPDRCNRLRLFVALLASSTFQHANEVVSAQHAAIHERPAGSQPALSSLMCQQAEMLWSI